MIIGEFLFNNPEVRRPFEAAYTAAICSGGVGQGKFRHGAVIIKDNTIISAGFNQYKSHPTLITQTKFPYLHAESHSMFKYGLDRLEGSTLYVIRIRSQEHIGLSKPCFVCEYFIKEANIKKVFYTTNEGYNAIYCTNQTNRI
jgi:deoxycytidylate deaminase